MGGVNSMETAILRCFRVDMAVDGRAVVGIKLCAMESMYCF